MSRKALFDILDRFETAMLVTRHGEELRSRPMAIVDRTPGGRLWFMTRAESAKLDELREHAEVNVAFQDGERFLSLTGTARIVRDAGKARELWSGSQRAWFPDGPEDPQLALICVEPRIAEYWDRAGLEGLRFLAAESRAIIAGDVLDDDAGKHEKVPLA